MRKRDSLSRRRFCALTAAAPLASSGSPAARIRIGLQLYSVRDQLNRDQVATLRGIGKMGYDGVEFYSPYFDWPADYAKQIKKVLDDTGMRCLSTHNEAKSFTQENLARAIELNQILGSKFVVMASAGKVETFDGWKAIADRLNLASEKLKPQGLRVGFHNHKAEFMAIDGRRPIEVLAANTNKDVVLQLDTGSCLEASSDPVAWINKNPGRFASVHCKDWSPDPEKGYGIVLGDGSVPWKKVFGAAESAGGVESYIIEQEGGSGYRPMDTVERCLAAFRKLHDY
jgi:sugar phosphate isomerase/epimerase